MRRSVAGQSSAERYSVDREAALVDRVQADCPMSANRAVHQRNARNAAVRKMLEEVNHEDVCDEFFIDLPFPCEEQFCTKIDEDGVYINYKHNTTMIITLTGTEKARVKKKTPKKYGKKKFDPELNEEEQEKYDEYLKRKNGEGEEDDDGDMTFGGV